MNFHSASSRRKTHYLRNDTMWKLNNLTFKDDYVFITNFFLFWSLVKFFSSNRIPRLISQYYNFFFKKKGFFSSKRRIFKLFPFFTNFVAFKKSHVWTMNHIVWSTNAIKCITLSIHQIATVNINDFNRRLVITDLLCAFIFRFGSC